MTSIWFKNSTNTYYPSNVKGNGMEVSFPLIIEPEVEINITLELDWYFTIGTEYYLYIEYDLGRTLRVIFTANTIN